MRTDWFPSHMAAATLDGSDPSTFLFHHFALDLHRRQIEKGGPPPLMTHRFARETRDPDFEPRLHKFALDHGLHPTTCWGTDIDGSAILSEKPDDFGRRHMLYLGDDAALLVECDVSSYGFNILTLDRAVLDEMLLLSKEVFKLSLNPVVHLLVRTQHGFDTRAVLARNAPLERGNYSPSVLKDYDRALGAFTAPNPFGRLVILDGPQGTGKSFMVRAFIHDVPPDKAMFLFIPANMVSSLAGPEIVTALLDAKDSSSSRSLILVVEDADSALVKRDGTNEAEVSTLLNLTDGIIGELLDVRVLCTTNRKLGDIDGAVQRKGRLVCHSHVAALSAEQANEVYERLTQAPREAFTKPTSLGDVYAAALDGGWMPAEKDDTVGFRPTGRSNMKNPETVH